MKGNRFILSIDSSNTESDKALIKFIESKGGLWHHWLNSTWLVIDPKSSISSKEFAYKINEIYPNVTFLLHLVDPKSYYGFGPNDDKNPEKNMFKWIEDYWFNKT